MLRRNIKNFAFNEIFEMNSAGIKKPRKSKKHGGAPEKQRRRKKITTGITLP